MVCKASLFLHCFLPLLCSSSNDPVYRTHRRNISFVAYIVLQKSVTNFPRKDAWVLLFVLLNLCHNIWSGHLRLASSNNTRLDRASLIIPAIVYRCGRKGTFIIRDYTNAFHLSNDLLKNKFILPMRSKVNTQKAVQMISGENVYMQN